MHGVPNWVTMSDAKQVSLGQQQKAIGAYRIKERDGKGCPKIRRLWDEVPEGGNWGGVLGGQTFQVKGSRYLKALPDCSDIHPRAVVLERPLVDSRDLPFMTVAFRL